MEDAANSLNLNGIAFMNTVLKINRPVGAPRGVAGGLLDVIKLYPLPLACSLCEPIFLAPHSLASHSLTLSYSLYFSLSPSASLTSSLYHHLPSVSLFLPFPLCMFMWTR